MKNIRSLPLQEKLLDDFVIVIHFQIDLILIIHKKCYD